MKIRSLIFACVFCSSCSFEKAGSDPIDANKYARENNFVLNEDRLELDSVLDSWSVATMAGSAAPPGTFEGILDNPLEMGSFSRHVDEPRDLTNCSRRRMGYISTGLVGRGVDRDSLLGRADHYVSFIRTPRGDVLILGHVVKIPDGRFFITSKRLDSEFIKNCRESPEKMFMSSRR